MRKDKVMEELSMEERFCKLVEWMGDLIDRGECDEFDISNSTLIKPL